MRFRRFGTITLDCYGTLIDWEAGVLAALRPMFAKMGAEASDDEILGEFLRLDEQFCKGAFIRYRSVLAQIVRQLGEQHGFAVSRANADVLTNSIADWQPFPETVRALSRLRRHFRLAIISNMDDDLIQASLAKLGTDFEVVMTSEQARCYKPGLGIFEHALLNLCEDGSKVIHVAEGLCEAEPARRLGMASVWVRRSPRSAGLSSADPDLTVPDLTTFVDLVEEQRADPAH